MIYILMASRGRVDVAIYLNTSLKDHGIANALQYLRILRLLRLFRLSRYMASVRLIGVTITNSVEEISFLFFLFILSNIFFGSVIWLLEENEMFTSIPASMWWSSITMTTVGYGDQVPSSTIGRVIAGLCSITGVLTLSLPLPGTLRNIIIDILLAEGLSN